MCESVILSMVLFEKYEYLIDGTLERDYTQTWILFRTNAVLEADREEIGTVRTGCNIFRDGSKGCTWIRQSTLISLRSHLLEFDYSNMNFL